MRRAPGIVVASLLACLSGRAEAAYSCPDSIMDRGAVKTADGGVDPPWARHYFRFAALYEGDPKHGAALTPSEEVKEDQLTQSWSLAASPGRRSVTLVCRYSGTSQTVQLALPDSVKRCALVTAKDGDPPPSLRCE